jgi:hypothetical protein
MAVNLIIDTRDVRFVLFEMLETDKLKDRYPQYAEQDRDVYEEILDLAERISVEKNYPVNSEADKAGCVYDPSTKTVKIPEGYREPIKAFYDAGFLALSESEAVMNLESAVIKANEFSFSGAPD